MLPSNLCSLLLPFDLEPPGRRQLHATFPQGFFRVVDVVLGRRDREDFHARFHPRRRTHGRPERGAHAFRDAVRTGSRGDLVFAEHVVRIQAELEVVRVPRFLRDVAVRRNPRGLEGTWTIWHRSDAEKMDLIRNFVRRAPMADLVIRIPRPAPTAYLL